MAKQGYMLCQCSICCKKEVLDKETNQIVPGVRLRRGEWLVHQTEDQGLKTRAKRRAQSELVLESGTVSQLSLKDSEPVLLGSGRCLRPAETNALKYQELTASKDVENDSRAKTEMPSYQELTASKDVEILLPGK